MADSPESEPADPATAPGNRAAPWKRHASLLGLAAVLNGVAVVAHTRFAIPLGLAGLFMGPMWLSANAFLLFAYVTFRAVRATPPPDLSGRALLRFRLRKRLRIASLLFAVILCFAVVEVFLRVSQRYATWSEVNGEGYASPYDDTHAREVVGWPPNVVTRMEQPEFSYEVRTNAEGMWDEEHPVQKPAGEYRVVALGDSFTMGQGASFAETWPQVLERSLAAAQVEVIGGGIAGCDPVFSVRLLERKLLKYSPDLVLLLVNTSDIGDIVSRGGFERFQDSGEVAFRPRPLLEPLFAHSHFARSILLDYFHYDFYLLRPEERKQRTDEAVDVIVEAAERLLALGRDRGFEVLVCVHPMRDEIYVKDDTPQPLWDYDLFGRLERRGIASFDLRPFLREQIPEGQLLEYFWAKDSHCNAKGYALFAEAIRQRLRSVPGFPRAE